MGVGGVNNTNTDLSIYKKIGGQNQSTTTAKPNYMTKDGSLWDAPGVKSLYSSSSSSTTSGITPRQGETKTQGSGVVAAGSGETSGAQSADDLIKGKSASEGRAAAKEAQGQQAGVRQGTTETQQNTNTTQDITSQTQETAKQVKKDNQTFKSQNQKSQSQFNKTNQQIKTLNQSINAEQTELASMNKELDSLLNADKTGIGSHSAFSLDLAGTADQTGAVDSGSGDAEKIQDLQNRIGEKTNVIKMYNQNVVVLTKQSNASLRSMERVNNAYVKTTNATQKQVESNQNEVSGFMEFANKFNEVSTTVKQVGTMVKYAGTAFIAMGGIPIVGAALAAAGNVMKPIGEATEAIGGYGQAAANVMLAAGNIAEGNFTAALGNIATAVQTGAAAVKSTKAATSSFKALGKETENIGKAAEQVTKESEQVQEKAEAKAQEATSPAAMDEAKPTELPDKLEKPTGQAAGDTTKAAAGGTPKMDPNAPIDAPETDLSAMADSSGMSDADVKKGLDKLKQHADNMNAERAEEFLRKQDAKAAWAELKADYKKIQSTLLAMGQKAENTTSNAAPEEKEQVEIQLSDRAKDIIAQGQKRRASIQAKYGGGSTVSNPVFYLQGRRVA